MRWASELNRRATADLSTSQTFFKKTFKSAEAPLAHTHFVGDVGSTRFRALVYLPSTLPNDFYSKDYVGLESLKLFVRRVFITKDLGKDYLPKSLNWVKVRPVPSVWLIRRLIPSCTGLH